MTRNGEKTDRQREYTISRVSHLDTEQTTTRPDGTPSPVDCCHEHEAS